MSSRLSWNSYFMNIARTVSSRATCPRRSVGAIIVRDRRIIATGYNGAPPNCVECIEVGCNIIDGHCKRATHAEMNAMLQAAKYGMQVHGSVMFTTMYPCLDCYKAIVSGGVARVIYDEEYAHDDHVQAIQDLIPQTGCGVVKCKGEVYV